MINDGYCVPGWIIIIPARYLSDFRQQKWLARFYSDLPYNLEDEPLWGEYYDHIKVEDNPGPDAEWGNSPNEAYNALFEKMKADGRAYKDKPITKPSKQDD